MRLFIIAPCSWLLVATGDDSHWSSLNVRVLVRVLNELVDFSFIVSLYVSDLLNVTIVLNEHRADSSATRTVRFRTGTL